MTLAQQLRNEGRQEGLNEGRQEGEREGTVAMGRQAVIEALEIRFGSVPEGMRESIATIDDPAKLRVLHRAAILAESVEVFAGAL